MSKTIMTIAEIATKKNIGKYTYKKYFNLSKDEDKEKVSLIPKDQLNNYIGKYVLMINKYHWFAPISIIKLSEIRLYNDNIMPFATDQIILRTAQGYNLIYQTEQDNMCIGSANGKYFDFYELDLPLKKYLHDTLKLIKKKKKTQGRISDLYK